MYSNDFQNKPSYVLSSDCLPENKTGSNKLVINGRPFYWEKYMFNFTNQPQVFTVTLSNVSLVGV